MKHNYHGLAMLAAISGTLSAVAGQDSADMAVDGFNPKPHEAIEGHIDIAPSEKTTGAVKGAASQFSVKTGTRDVATDLARKRRKNQRKAGNHSRNYNRKRTRLLKGKTR